MNSAINTFTLQLPVSDEILTVMIFMFCGVPKHNGKKNYSYSLVGHANGMRFRSMEVQVIANYGKGCMLTDEPVIKNNQFIFSNECDRPVDLEMKLNVKAFNKAGAIVAALFIIEVKFTLQKFMVSAVHVRYALRSGAILSSPDTFANHLQTAG